MLDLELISRRFEREKSRRANFDTLWQEIALRVWPAMADFNTKQSPGARRTEVMFDGTAALAAQKAVAAISAFVWPGNQRYQKLTTTEPELNKSHRVKAYLDEVTDVLFRARYSPRAAFEAQMGEAGLQHFVFGTGLLYVGDNIKGQAVTYKSVHLGQAYLSESMEGRVDTVYRCWPWTLRQIEQRWPGKLPTKYAEKLRTHPDTELEVSHAVFPRTDYNTEAIGYPGMPWVSMFWLPSEKHVLEEGGLHSWPYAVLRYSTSPGEVYGRGPAWMVLSNIKVLNAQKRDVLKAAQKVVDPPLLAYDDGATPFSQVPGAMNYGTLDSQGNQLVKPLITNAKVELGLEMMDKEREIIATASMMDVFRVLAENPQMTATQTLELMNERAIHMAPVAGRIESEGLGPMTERELDILMRAGQLPEMPPEMIEAQGEYKIEYTSPMRKAMRASEAIAIARTMEQVLPLAQADPSVLDEFDLPAAAREVADIQGVPAKILRDDDTKKRMKEARADQQQATQLLEAAPLVSDAAANLAKMQAAGGMQPGL